MVRHLAFAIAALAGSTGAALACPDPTQQGAPYLASGSELGQARHFAVEAGGTFDLGRCGQIDPSTDAGPGFFNASPHFSFQITELQSAQLVVSVISHCDAVVLVNTPLSAWYYDDNDNGDLNPRLVFSTPSSGRYDIWVGTRDGAFCDAILSMESFER